MTLIQIYLLGIVVQAIYMAIKRLMWSQAKRQAFQKGWADICTKHGINLPIAVELLMIALMCLLWPYIWFENLLLKRK